MNDDHSHSTGRDLARLAFDLAPSGMLAVGPAGGILLANREAEQLFGYGPDEMVGVPVERLVPQAQRDRHVEFRAEFFRAPSARRMGAGRDLRGVRHDGSEFPVEVGLSPVDVETGTVVVVSVVDISARLDSENRLRDNEERARQAQKLEALGTLAGGIAHDFNNILLGIVGYTELAQRETRDRPAVGDDLDQVLRAAERGRQLVRRILMFARQQDPVRVPVDLDRVVREATELLRASLPATIEMRVAIDSDVPRVLADETLVHQILMNLGTNSSHAMEEGGVLRVELSTYAADTAFLAAHPELSAARYAKLAVSDNGTGMTPEVRARLFEPFFTTKPAGRGSGLGLSVILGIVQSLEGAIQVTSAPGEGTRVEVWLPAAVSTLGAAAASEQVASGSQAQPHVLLVEDEAPLAAMERRQLESLGYRVTAHTSSEEALADFRARPEAFDLLITDNTMPRMTGLVLSRHVSSLRPDLPVLMVSGYAEFADADVLREHGVRLVLRKPHSVKELGEALRRVLVRE